MALGDREWKTGSRRVSPIISSGHGKERKPARAMRERCVSTGLRNSGEAWEVALMIFQPSPSAILGQRVGGRLVPPLRRIPTRAKATEVARPPGKRPREISAVRSRPQIDCGDSRANG